MSATRKNLAKIRGQYGSPVGDAAAAATKNIAKRNIIRAGLPTVGAANGNVALYSTLCRFELCVVVAAAWIGLVGYGLVELAELAF